MTIDELKKEIELKTGVPAALLTGETIAENLAQAETLLNYKREYTQEQPKPPREQFNSWFNAFIGYEPQDKYTSALDEIKTAAMLEYPAVKDGGEVSDNTDPRSTQEKFADWLNEVTAVKL